jgi:RNA polymerase sigma-70 factor (ECF subfamily)
VVDPDLELLNRWRTGDKRAGNELYQRHFVDVSAFFAIRFPSAQEDLIQETFLGLVKAVERFEGRSSFRTYLFRIARNVFREAMRRRMRPHRTFDPLVDSIAEVSGRTVSSAVAQNESLQLLLNALLLIPCEMQDLLELYYFQELKVAEVAEVLEILPNTVKSRLSAARKRLLDKYLELAGDSATLLGDEQLEEGLRRVREPVLRGTP